MGGGAHATKSSQFTEEDGLCLDCGQTQPVTVGSSAGMNDVVLKPVRAARLAPGGRLIVIIMQSVIIAAVIIAVIINTSW